MSREDQVPLLFVFLLKLNILFVSCQMQLALTMADTALTRTWKRDVHGNTVQQYPP